MGIETSISVFMVLITIVLAYLGRNSEQDYIKGLFSMLAVYMLVVVSALARKMAQEAALNSTITSLLGGVLITMFLVALFLTTFMVYSLFKQVSKLLVERKGGITIDEEER